MRTRSFLAAGLATLAAACTHATTTAPHEEISPVGGLSQDPAQRLAGSVRGTQDPDAVRSDAEEPHYHSEPLYAVVLVEENDVLNVRAAAGVEHEVLETLPPASTELTGTGREEMVDGQRWVELLLTTGSGAGWVNAFYLTDLMSPTDFCADAQVQDLLVDLEQALVDKNGEQLFATVSPIRGLSVRFVPGGIAQRFTDDQARLLFEAHEALDWGAHPYTGEQVHGSFTDMVRPDILEVFGGAKTAQACNQLTVGGTAYDANWPSEYSNFNFYALHAPGTEESDGLDWVTWVVGVDYSEGVPYVVALERFAR